MRPHMKLAQYSHQCGPLNVWTWKWRETKWWEGTEDVERVYYLNSRKQIPKWSWDYVWKNLWSAASLQLWDWFPLFQSINESSQHFAIYFCKSFHCRLFNCSPGAMGSFMYMIQIPAYSEFYCMKRKETNRGNLGLVGFLRWSTSGLSDCISDNICWRWQ